MFPPIVATPFTGPNFCIINWYKNEVAILIVYTVQGSKPSIEVNLTYQI